MEDGYGRGHPTSLDPKDFAKRCDLWERYLSFTRESFKPTKRTVLAVAHAKILNRSGDAGRWYLSTPRGILISHPFLDRRVLKYCLGIHSRIDPLPRGLPKPLLGEALRGVIPDRIRVRPKAGLPKGGPASSHIGTSLSQIKMF